MLHADVSTEMLRLFEYACTLWSTRNSLILPRSCYLQSTCRKRALIGCQHVAINTIRLCVKRVKMVKIENKLTVRFQRHRVFKCTGGRILDCSYSPLFFCMQRHFYQLICTCSQLAHWFIDRWQFERRRATKSHLALLASEMHRALKRMCWMFIPEWLMCQ